MFKLQRRTPTAETGTRSGRFPRLIFQLFLIVPVAGLMVWSLAFAPVLQTSVLGQEGSQTGESDSGDSEYYTPLDEEDLLDYEAAPEDEIPSDDIPLEIPDEALIDLDAEDGPGLGRTLSLPDPAAGWADATFITVDQLQSRFADLLTVEATGDFQFFYTPGADRGSIRILPLADSLDAQAGESFSLTLAWRLGDEWLLPLPVGRRIDVEVGARLYSPPDGVVLAIREQVGGEWRSSSVAMQDIQWTTYGLSREISPDAQQAQIALLWQPSFENAWVEFQLPHIVIGRPEIAAAPLSPTDTPTPAAAPTVAATPEPEPTPQPEIEPVDEPPPTPTPLPPVADEVPPESGDDAVGDEVAPAEAAEQAEQEPVEEPTATPTPTYIIVTSTPTPVDVFEEATRVAVATSWAPILGTSTPTPENLATPTETPTPFVIIVTNTPVPQNQATAVYQQQLATAVAFTTGTPTPFPAEAQVRVATNTPAPQAQPPQPTNTPTPLFVLLDQLPPTATPQPQAEFPAELIGKIMFLTNFQATVNQPNVLIMNPDGSELGIMGTRMFYNRAVARDAYSSDQRFHVYVQREGVAATGTFLQIKYNDTHYEGAVANPMSFFANGNSWSPVWSPVRQSVAFVSNDSGNDEIYLVDINEWPARKLTNNEWEWDHHPSFSPDGSQIVFSSNRITGVRQIWMMDAGGGNQRQITNFPFQAWNPVWVKYPDS